MADHRHRQGKAPIYSSQAPGHSMIPKGSYSSYYPGTTAACPTTQVVQTRSHKDYSRLEESKHQHWEHSVAVGASALTEKHQIMKPQIKKNEKHVIEKHRIEKHVIEKHVIEKYQKEKHGIEKHVIEKYRNEKHVIEKYQNEKHVIEKYLIESDPKHAHRHRIKEVVAVALGAHAVCEHHLKKKAHKPKEATSGKKHGHHLF